MSYDLLLYSADQFAQLNIDSGVMITGANLDPISVSLADDDGKINDLADPGNSDHTVDLIQSSGDPSLVGEEVIVDNGPGQTLQHMLFTGGRDIDGDGGVDYGYVAEVTLNGQIYIVTSVNNPLVANMDYTTGNPTEVLIESAGWNHLGFSTVTCFAKGALVETPAGTVPIEQLCLGDLVETMEHGEQAIRWIGQRRFNKVDLEQNPKLRPVRILAGALGEGLPLRDLLVSAQHRILVHSRIAERLFGKREVLIAAIKLTALPGIFVDQEIQEIEYFHLLLEKHEILYVEGAPTESLLIGPGAVEAIGHDAVQEIAEIFPDLTLQNFHPSPARYVPSGQMQKRLVARHFKNQKSCLSFEDLRVVF